jgi:hypothetical protein
MHVFLALLILNHIHRTLKIGIKLRLLGNNENAGNMTVHSRAEFDFKLNIYGMDLRESVFNED